METNINIYLHDNDTSNATNPKDPGTTPQPDNPIENQGKQGESNKFSTKMIAAYVGKQALSFATARVGQATRDNLRQQQVNAGLKMGVYAGLIVANPIMGGLALATDLITSSIDYNHSAREEKRTLNIINARAGNINRSR